jgi:hypothetical protein
MVARKSMPAALSIAVQLRDVRFDQEQNVGNIWGTSVPLTQIAKAKAANDLVVFDLLFVARRSIQLS